MSFRELTAEEEARLPEYRDKWLAIGTNTDPTDDVKAVEAIKLMYQDAGKTEPPEENIFLLNSPVECSRAAAYIEAVWHYLPDSAKPNLAENLPRIVAEGFEVEEKHKKHYREVYGRSIDLFTYGQHNAAWLAFYSFFKEVRGEEGIASLEGFKATAMELNWILPFEEHCFASRKPTTLKFDPEGRLHNEHGPSFAFADGFKAYDWHGTRIPEEWIEDKPPSAQDLLQWQNTEQRLAGCELLGWVNILKELDAKLIAAHEDPEIGTLYDAELPDQGTQRFLKVQCGTGREFAVLVPSDIDDPQEANASTYGIRGEEAKKWRVGLRT